MQHFGELTAQIEVLVAREAGGDQRHEIARAMEDLLCDGYAACLQVDSQIRRLDRRRRELTALGDEGRFSDDLRELDERRDDLERCVAEARRKLAALRERFVRIGGGQTAFR